MKVFRYPLLNLVGLLFCSYGFGMELQESQTPPKTPTPPQSRGNTPPRSRAESRENIVDPREAAQQQIQFHNKEVVPTDGIAAAVTKQLENAVPGSPKGTYKKTVKSLDNRFVALQNAVDGSWVIKFAFDGKPLDFGLTIETVSAVDGQMVTEIGFSPASQFIILHLANGKQIIQVLDPMSRLAPDHAPIYSSRNGFMALQALDGTWVIEPVVKQQVRKFAVINSVKGQRVIDLAFSPDEEAVILTLEDKTKLTKSISELFSGLWQNDALHIRESYQQVCQDHPDKYSVNDDIVIRKVVFNHDESLAVVALANGICVIKSIRNPVVAHCGALKIHGQVTEIYFEPKSRYVIVNYLKDGQPSGVIIGLSDIDITGKNPNKKPKVVIDANDQPVETRFDGHSVKVRLDGKDWVKGSFDKTEKGLHFTPLEA